MRKKARNKRDKDRKAVLIILVSVFVVIGALLIKSSFEKANRIDPESLCPLDGAKGQTVVIIDKSDKWGEDDVSRVDDLLSRVFRDTRAGHRLTILSIHGKGRETTKVDNVFDKCSPGSEKECNSLIQNCRRVIKKYNQFFEDRVTEVVASLKEPGESSYSPLFETVAQVVDDSVGQKLSIHLVSDLMENGRKFRFYDVVPLAEEIVNEYPLHSASNITVDMHVVERRRHSRELIDAVESVWIGYFEDQGIHATAHRLFIAD